MYTAVFDVWGIVFVAPCTVDLMARQSYMFAWATDMVAEVELQAD